MHVAAMRQTLRWLAAECLHACCRRTCMHAAAVPACMLPPHLRHHCSLTQPAVVYTSTHAPACPPAASLSTPTTTTTTPTPATTLQGRYGVYYDDGDVEALDLAAETWRMEEEEGGEGAAGTAAAVQKRAFGQVG